MSKEGGLHPNTYHAPHTGHSKPIHASHLFHKLSTLILINIAFIPIQSADFLHSLTNPNLNPYPINITCKHTQKGTENWTAESHQNPTNFNAHKQPEEKTATTINLQKSYRHRLYNTNPHKASNHAHQTRVRPNRYEQKPTSIPSHLDNT